MFNSWNETKKLNTSQTYAPIVFVNKPVTETNYDVIGFDSQVETLQNAINDGATMIGVIADYGTGKSSMTELLCSAFHKKGNPKPIKINMWDCLTEETDHTNHNISNLTKSFLFQLSNGHKSSFGSYINKILSKNYGSISFSASNPKRLYFFASIACLFWVLYLTTSVRGSGILNVLPQFFTNIAPFLKILSPWFMIGAVVTLFLGLIDISIAFSHWKMTDKREIEINDVFDTYRAIIDHISPPNGKKQLIFIDDLDRIDDKQTIITFLKEIYRFQDSIKDNEKNKIVFIVSVKPESELKEKVVTQVPAPQKEQAPASTENENSKIYSKVFDTTLFLKPIHFDDYDSILLRLIKSDPAKQQSLERLIGEKIGTSLPASFKWIKNGSNLTLRDLKDRLNHAIAIMASLKSKSYKDNSAADFMSCTAVVYLENQFPNEYYQLIKNEEAFAEFMRQSYKIVNEAKTSDDIVKLNATFKTTFKNQAYCQAFVDALCSMVFDGIFNDDFRMYFYTYPKDSHIKTTEERVLCNCLLFPNQNPAPLNFDEYVSHAYSAGKNECIADTLRTLDTFPPVVLKNDTLFKHAAYISLPKTFSVFSKEIISVFDFENDLSPYWTRIKQLEKHTQQVFIQNCVEKVLLFSKADSIIRTRIEIIKGYGEDILAFSDLYAKDTRIPQITAEEINAIQNPAIAVQLVDVEKVTADQREYLCNLVTSKPLIHLKNAGEQALSIITKISKMFTPAEIGGDVLKFLQINRTFDDDLFGIVCRSGLSHEHIAEYLNMFDPAAFSQKYLELIDMLGFDGYIKDETALTLAKNNLFYTPVLYYAKENCLHCLEPFLENSSSILLATKKINEINPDTIIAFRKYCVFTADAQNLEALYYGNYPLITAAEFKCFPNTRIAIEHINTTAIEEENIPDILAIINSRVYTLDELIFLFEYMFDPSTNEDCIDDEDIVEALIDAMDFKQFNVRALSAEQRSKLFAAFSNKYSIRNSNEAREFTRHFGCFVPEIESIISNDKATKKDYCNLIAEMDELTDVALDWIQHDYLIAPVSEKICDVLFEKGWFVDYIIANILRNGHMIMDSRIKFCHYIEAYSNIDEVFDVMSNHWDFLEQLQLEVKFDSLTEKQIIPMFMVRQSERLFTYVLSDQTSSALKQEYLNEFGKFREEKDSVAFQRLICKPENIKLVNSYELKARISQQLWDTNRSHKAVFTRKWNEEWASKLSQPQPV